MFNVDIMNINAKNGFQAMFVSSADARDRLIKKFKVYVDAGYDPNDVIDRVLKETGINEDDLLDEDVDILNRTIEDYLIRRKSNGLY